MSSKSNQKLFRKTAISIYARTLCVAMLAGPLSLGCSAKVVNLGDYSDGNVVYSSGIPVQTGGDAGNSGASFRLVDKEHNECSPSVPISFTVNSGRLYWVASRGPQTAAHQVLLRSCSVEDCANTVTTLSSVDSNNDYSYCASYNATELQVDSGEVYWVSFPGPNYFLVDAPIGMEATISAQKLPVNSGGNSLVNDGIFYIASSGSTVLRCQVSNCAATLERFLMNAPIGEAPYQGTNAAGIVGKDANYLYLWESPYSTTARLLRVPLDLNANFEVLAEGSGSDDLSTAKLYGDNLYWLESTPMGQLKTCPKAGCVGSPTVLMSGLNSPSEVAVDDTSVYVLEPPELGMSTNGMEQTLLGPGRVLKCPITGCSDPQVIYSSTEEYNLSNLLVDDRFVYLAGNNCPNSYPSSSGPCGYIAAIVK